jgi:NTP pyrophosphatase (non-canonical NTP hydrolase)
MEMRLDFRTYQEEAASTDRLPITRKSRSDDAQAFMMPLLGLAGETGSLLTEYKKWLIEGDAYTVIADRVSEELGDVLWYLSNLATKARLDLEDIAAANLRKTKSLQKPVAGLSLALFDEAFPAEEQLPRRFTAKLKPVSDGSGRERVSVIVNNKVCGNPLTDNAYVDDGYRFHDVFHLSYAAVLGWSPIWRRLLARKRKSLSAVDEVEDGARAAIIEECISALVFSYAEQHSYFRGIREVSYDVLRRIMALTDKLEVARVGPSGWQRAILQGYAVWRQVVKHNGGVVRGDLRTRTLMFERPLPRASKRPASGSR